MQRRYHDAERRAAIFEDTMDMCWDNPVLSDAIDDTVERTVLYGADTPLKDVKGGFAETKINVTDERSLAAAQRLHGEYPDSRIAVLNFASATNPGGGVKSGSSAQEESICRCSTLYQCLDTNSLIRQFYGMHRKRSDVRYTDTCIYTPDIIAFKSDTMFPELMNESDWFKVDIITCAAPNLRKIPYNRMNPGKGKAISLSDDELLEIHIKRGRHILSAAIENGAEIMVLGAFGCGAFANNPDVVAKAYKKLLTEYAGCFRAVCFAVYCPPYDMTNYRIFSEILGDD
ncbi:MAG: TIGR02452 family protein [Oscillospiraceae bacterium]|nr:TIGR02452 family protein [Oscillospiraceae bacterium]